METPSNRPVNVAGSGAVPEWAGLMPVGIVALGTPSQPVERLPGVQSPVYRLIVWLAELRLPRLAERVPMVSPETGRVAQER